MMDQNQQMLQNTMMDATSGQRSNEGQNVQHRKPQGLLKSYHGIVYQIQWIMMVALQARREGADSGFTFRTEEDENDVGKFDDVVWHYRGGEEKKYNFLQCKHKLNPQEKITINELCKAADQNNNPFSLQKYFISFRDHIRPNPKYKDGLIENLIIATNIDFADNIKNSFKVARKINPVLKVLKSTCKTEVYPQCWKLDSSSVHQGIIKILEETYDLIQLAEVLGEYIRNQLPFTLPNNLKLYSKALCEDIIDAEKNTLSDNFINGSNLCKQAEFLREAFFHQLFVKKRISLNVSHDYILSNPTEFAKALALYLHRSKDKVVGIQRKASIVKTNIDKLAGYVLIEEDGLKFNYKFWTSLVNELPHESLHIFRTVLIADLQQYGIVDSQDSLITIADKLDAYRFTITNFITCRNELLDESSFWDYAKRYNGFKNICDIAKCIKEKRHLPNYGLNDIKKNIEDFFDIFVFAVGYSREYLTKFVQYDLRTDFGCINNEYIAEAFRSQIAKSLDLVEDRFISTSEDVDIFFNIAKQQINRFVLVGPTLEYRIKIFSYDVKFSRNSISTIKLRPFIAKSSLERVLGISTAHTKLSSIKVHQILESIPEYKYKTQSNDFIFMCLSTVLCLFDIVIHNFEFNYNLLIIECDTMTTTLDDEQYLCSEICRIVTLNCNKKVVLIGEKDNCLARILKENFGRSFKEVLDRRNNFLNLTKSSQDILLTKTRVSFQGEQIHLSALLENHMKYLVNGDVLYRVINGEEIKIGVASSSLGKVKDYYIDRTFYRRLALDTKVFEVNDMFAISNTDIFEFKKEIFTLSTKNDTRMVKNAKIRQFNDEDPNKNDPIKYIILDHKLASTQFKTLSHNYERFNIHWVNKEDDVYVWQQTYGSLSNLQSYLRKEIKEDKQLESEFTKVIKLKNITIVSAEPGMGKSTVTTNLESLMKTQFHLWIVRINLLHYSTDFKNSIDKAFVIQFIYKAAKLQFQVKKECLIPLQSNVAASIQDGKILVKGVKNFKSLELLELQLFNHYYNHGRVVLLFDGYDEICSFYEKKVTGLFKILSTLAAHIYITTRPYDILSNLENTFHDFSYALKPLTNDEQKSFLIKYWKSRLNLNIFNENRAHVFIAELLHKFSETTSDEDRNFVGIPLQLRMLAANFLDVFAEFYHSNVENLNDVYLAKIKKQLNIVHLYEDFIKIKFEEIRFKEKKPGINTDFADMQEIINRERIKFIDDHQKLALYALFKDNVDKLLSSNENHDEQNFHRYVQKLLENINEGDEENGIIYCVIDKYPIFVHQSFAEYFVAIYLWEKFKSTKTTIFKAKFIDDMLLNNVFTGKYLQICRFFYCSAEKDFKENVDFIDKDDKINVLLKSLVSIITTLYRLYQNGGTDQGNGTDGLTTSGQRELLRDPFYTHEKPFKDFFKSVNYVSCIRLLFRIVECYLSGKEPKSDGIATIIKNDGTNNLLLMAAELGCLNFIKIFVITKQLDYNSDLSHKKWYFTPIWLAAKKQHLEVVKYFKDTFNPNWKDKDGLSLLQRIFDNNEIKVLRSCLILNICDGNPYKNGNNYNAESELPLSKALANDYPADIIKLLLKKSNIEKINKFTQNPYSGISEAYRMAINLTEYDGETVHLVVNSGINFFGVLNVLFYEYCYASFYGPTNMLKYFKGLCYIYSDKQYTGLLNFIKVILKSGVSFNSKDNTHNKSTLQYISQTYYINSLLNEITTSENQTGIILKLIFEIVSYIGSISIRKSVKNIPEIFLMIGFNDEIKILMPDRLVELITGLCSKSYQKISSHLYELHCYLQNAQQEIHFFKDYPDSTLYQNILTGYAEMLEFTFKRERDKAVKFKSLGNVEKMLLTRVLKLYISQGYDIEAAFKEVAAEVLKVKALSTWIIKKEDFQSPATAGELLEILDSEDVIINEELKTKVYAIYKCGGLKTLCEIWSNLNEAGQQNVSEVLRSMTKHMSLSKEIYGFFNGLEESYVNLTVAITSRHYSEIENILQTVETSYKKAVINGQDDAHGSPLHYVVYNGDFELTSLLLDHGANPNYKLGAHGTLLSQLTNINDRIEEDAFEENYEGYTPLHLAIIMAQTRIVQLLLSYGADCNILVLGLNSLQLAEENLKQIENIYEHGAACFITVAGRNSLQLTEEELQKFEIIYKQIILILKESSLTTSLDNEECNPKPSTSGSCKRKKLK